MKPTKIPKLFADFTKITIPDGLNFAELKLTRDPVTGEVEFECAPLAAICEANGIDVAQLCELPEDNVAALLIAWYMKHRDQGGAADRVEEQLLSEIAAEDMFGAERVQRASGCLN